MITLNEICFPVEKVLNPEVVNSEYSFKVEALIDGQKKVLNYCSPVYRLSPNFEVFPVIEQRLHNRGFEIEKAYKMNEDHTRFTAKYILKKLDGNDLGINVGTAQHPDIIYPTLDTDNSYNGKKGVVYSLGYFRFVCSNGVVIPLEGYEDINIEIKSKHTRKLALNFDSLILNIEKFIETADLRKKKIEVLTDRAVLNFADRLEEVMKATHLPMKQRGALKKGEVPTERGAIYNEIYKRIETEAKTYFGGRVTDWLIYNGINTFIFKGIDSIPKATPEMKRKKDKEVFEYIASN